MNRTVFKVAEDQPRAEGWKAFLELVRVTPQEVPKVAMFLWLGALGTCGLAIGMSVSSSLFLVHIGSDKLYILFLGMPLLMVMYAPLASWLLPRLGIDLYYRWVLRVLVVGGVLLALVLPSRLGLAEPVSWAFFFASFYTGFWSIVLYTTFWSYTGDYFDIRDAKRLYPVLTAGMAAGSIVGGLLVSVLSQLGWVGELLVLWSILAVAALIPLRRIGQRWQTLEGGTEVALGESFGTRMRKVVTQFRRVRYVKLLTLMLFGLMMLTALCSYQSLTLISLERSEGELAALLGVLYALVNGLNLLINLMLFNRLVVRLGVPGTALVVPLAFLGVFALLALSPGMTAAVLAFLVYEGLLSSVDFNNQNFLFNALPSAAGKEIRGLIESLIEPLATASVGGLLLLQGSPDTQRTTDMTIEQIGGLARWGFFGALVVIVLGLLLRPAYMKSMVVNLKQHWLDFSRPSRRILQEVPESELDVLWNPSAKRELNEWVLALHLALMRENPVKAMEHLLPLLKQADASQAKLLSPILGELLAGQDARVLRLLLGDLETLRRQGHGVILQELGRYRLLRPDQIAFADATSSSAAQRAISAVILLSSWKPAHHRQGLELVEGLLEGTASAQVEGLRALGASGQRRFAFFLLPFLDASSAEVREAALSALSQLADAAAESLSPTLLRQLGDTEDVASRTRLLEILAVIGDVESLPPLLAVADTLTPFERRQCEALVERMDLKAVPTLVQVLSSADASYPARSLASRALGRMAPAQLAALSPDLIRRELLHAYSGMRRATLLEARQELAPGLQVLRRLHGDAPRAAVDFILELLSISGQLPDYEMLSAALRSRNVRQRGDAIETLEQGIDRWLFHRLLPLVDGRSQQQQVAFFERHFQPPPESQTRIVVDALSSPVGIEVAAALQCIWGSQDTELWQALGKRLQSSLPERARHELDCLVSGGDAFIDKLACLAHSEFFSTFDLASLERLASEATFRSTPMHQILTFEGGSSDVFYVLAGGKLWVEETEHRWEPAVGDVLGQEALLGLSAPALKVVSHGAQLLVLSMHRLHRLAQADPRLALGLLEKKIAAGHGPRQEAA